MPQTCWKLKKSQLPSTSSARRRQKKIRMQNYVSLLNCPWPVASLMEKSKSFVYCISALCNSIWALCNNSEWAVLYIRLLIGEWYCPCANFPLLYFLPREGLKRKSMGMMLSCFMITPLILFPPGSVLWSFQCLLWRILTFQMLKCCLREAREDLSTGIEIPAPVFKENHQHVSVNNWDAKLELSLRAVTHRVNTDWSCSQFHIWAQAMQAFCVEPNRSLPMNLCQEIMGSLTMLSNVAPPNIFHKIRSIALRLCGAPSGESKRRWLSPSVSI